MVSASLHTPDPLARLDGAHLTGIAVATRGDWVRLTGADFSVTFTGCTHVEHINRLHAPLTADTPVRAVTLREVQMPHAPPVIGCWLRRCWN